MFVIETAFDLYYFDCSALNQLNLNVNFVVQTKIMFNFKIIKISSRTAVQGYPLNTSLGCKTVNPFALLFFEITFIHSDPRINTPSLKCCSLYLRFSCLISKDPHHTRSTLRKTFRNITIPVLRRFNARVDVYSIPIHIMKAAH